MLQSQLPPPQDSFELNIYIAVFIIIAGVAIWVVFGKLLPIKPTPKKRAKEVEYDFEEWDGYHESRKTRN